MVWKIILCFLFGYLIGGINSAYIIGKIRGVDIRQKGSNNAGASNATILFGKLIGVFSALFDIAKAFCAFFFAPQIFKGLLFAAEIAGVASILGHIFPAWMKFRGGKGLACLGGVLLAIDWRFFLILLAAELVLCIIVNYICVVPITAAIIIPIAYGLFGKQGVSPLLRHAENGWWGAAILAVATLAILYKHIQNIYRIHHGTELHLSYLWQRDKQAEIDRVRANQARLAAHIEEKEAAKHAAKTSH